MSDSLIDSVELTVLNGPTEIDLEVDFGRPGVRGSQIYIVPGDPNASPEAVPVGVRYNDLVINNSQSVPEDYLNVYQYMNSGGVDLWEKVFRITTNFYSYSGQKVFEDGSATVNILVRSVVGSEIAASMLSSNFNVQCTIAGSNNPIASSINLGQVIEQDDEFLLPITINAAEFDGTSWALVNELRTVHLFITVI